MRSDALLSPPPAQGLSLRLGGIAAITGSLAGLVGNVIHPDTAGPHDPQATATVVAGSATWIPIHLVLVVAFVLMLGGLIAIHDSITAGPGRTLVRFGLWSAVVGTAVGVVLVSLDGFAAKSLADSWAAAGPGGRELALVAFRSEDAINFALLSPFNIVFAGFTFALFGIGTAISGSYPRWQGFAVAAAAVLGAVSGAIQAFNGEPALITQVLGIASPTVITLWLTASGVIMIRRRKG